MKKRIKSIICIVLTVALIIGFAPNLGASVVKAGEVSTLTINASDINAAIKKGEKRGDGWEIGTGSEYYLYLTGKETILNMNESLKVGVFIAFGSLTIKGNNKLSAVVVDVYGDATLNGANLDIRGQYEWNFICEGDIKIIASTITSKCTFGNTMHGVSSSRIDARQNIYAMGKIELSGGSYIKTPSNGKVSTITSNQDSVQVVPTYSAITDSKGDAPEYIEIAVESTTPASNDTATPTKENTDNSSGKKSYKNEWVDGQWYDANGKTDYKYKGGWKKNSTGWWYEDENGWFPTARWQKIDGDWYYFDDIGYMASNEYAGNWTAYSEGYWWVGEDGAWDGSEPGVWRLSGTKWWFKDSTGWYAKGKWYKIGGTWYEFDADGWWIEK